MAVNRSCTCATGWVAGVLVAGAVLLVSDLQEENPINKKKIDSCKKNLIIYNLYSSLKVRKYPKSPTTSPVGSPILFVISLEYMLNKE